MKTFLEVFPDLHIAEKVRGLLEMVGIEKISTNRDRSVIRVEFDHDYVSGAADALVTVEPDLCLSVAVADCVPVALVGEREVGMVHSGWRGTLARVSGKAAQALGGSRVRAYIGPSIRRCCYEVSEELAAKFAAQFGEEVVSGRNLSLQDAIRLDLQSAGIEVDDLGLCSGCRPDLFYSHRRQGPLTGRNLASVVREAR